MPIKGWIGKLLIKKCLWICKQNLIGSFFPWGNIFSIHILMLQRETLPWWSTFWNCINCMMQVTVVSEWRGTFLPWHCSPDMHKIISLLFWHPVLGEDKISQLKMSSACKWFPRICWIGSRFLRWWTVFWKIIAHTIHFGAYESTVSLFMHIILDWKIHYHQVWDVLYNKHHQEYLHDHHQSVLPQ